MHTIVTTLEMWAARVPSGVHWSSLLPPSSLLEAVMMVLFPNIAGVAGGL